MKNLMVTADDKPKWKVIRRVKAWRRPGYGDLGYVPVGLVFYSKWWEDGYISINKQKWIPMYAVEQVNEQEPTDPPPATNLYYLLGDLELQPQLLKAERNNVPQTVRFIHEGNGSIRYTERLINWMLALNPTMNRSQWEGMCDAWNRKGEKFRDGERKFPFEIGFACNTHLVKRRLIWGGGLGFPKGTRMLELDTLHPDFLPEPELVIGTPHIIHLNTIAGVNVNPFSGRDNPPRYSALISPVKLYIEEARCRPVTVAPNPYCPAWMW